MEKLLSRLGEIEINITLLNAQKKAVEKQILKELSESSKAAQTGETQKAPESTTEDRSTQSPI